MFSQRFTKNNQHEEFDFFNASDKCVAIANFFINNALENNSPITRKKVLKLTFMAQGFALATLEKSLYPDTIEAWPAGPVIPGLYFELKNTNPVFIEEPLSTNYDLKEDERQLLKAVNDKYGVYSGDQLSILTHKPNTPWSLTKRRMETVIDQKNIEAYYKKLLTTKFNDN